MVLGHNENYLYKDSHACKTIQIAIKNYKVSYFLEQYFYKQPYLKWCQVLRRKMILYKTKVFLYI